MEEDAVRWSIKVSKSTDTAVRTLLAQKGLKKGDLSKFIAEAARQLVFSKPSKRRVPETRIFRRQKSKMPSRKP